MIAFILRRFLISIPLLLAISFITFGFIQSVPGNYFDRMRMDPLISEETILAYQHEHHLDEPVVVQFGYWLGNLARLDFGYSFELKKPVWDVIKDRWWNTLILSISSLLFAWLIAIPLGIFCAVRQYRLSDKLFSFLAFMGMSLPNFFFAMLLLYAASFTFDLSPNNWLHGILPLGGMQSTDYPYMTPLGKAWDLFRHLIIPTVVIGTAAVAALQRIMRGNLLEVLRTQYVTTARAKGLPEHKVIYSHALRNAINPMITLFGGELSGLLSGAALTEIICGWPGLGSIMLTAVRSQDVFLVMGSTVLGGIMVIVGYLVSDILLAASDPRIQLR
jgi:peptide/nickel transport system permease protein